MNYALETSRNRSGPIIADIVFVNGLKLEYPTKEIAESNLPCGSEIVEVDALTISPDILNPG